MLKKDKKNNEDIGFVKKYSKVVREIEEEDNLEDENVREVIVEGNSGFNTIEVVIIIIIAVLFGIVVGSILTYSRNNVITTSEVSKELEEFVATYENIVDNYYDKVDKEELLNSAVAGMVNSLDDPYSVFMDSTQTGDFDETVDGNYIGIGATIAAGESGNYVISMFSNSPAKKAGLKVGDIIKKANGKDVSTMSLNDLTKKIKGKNGTKLEITVLRDEKEVTVKITRGSVDIPSVSSKIIDGDNWKIGYIAIDTFASNTYKQFRNKLIKLENKNIQSLIIDVRCNPGGHLNQVTKILELFMNKKKVLYQIEVKGKTQKVYSTTKESRDYEIAIIIDSGSASASEILAAAFKDSYPKSHIVGVNSYGKGTVQNSYKLSTGASIKYTTEKWLTPKGKWINDLGVTPTETVELSEEYFNNPTEDTDNQLQKAISILN